MFLRYRQTPLPLKRVKAHAVWREHQLLLSWLFNYWRISRTRMQANAFYLYVFCLFYLFIGCCAFVNRLQIYDLFLETSCVAALFYASRTQSGTAFTFQVCVNGLLGSIARRQFVPTNCVLLPSLDCRGD